MLPGGILSTSVASVIQNLKEVTLEFVASSCSMQDLLEENMASVNTSQQAMVVKQVEMDKWMKSMDSRKDIMGEDLRAIFYLLKKPYVLGYEPFLCCCCCCLIKSFFL